VRQSILELLPTMLERFSLDQQQNILFIDFAGLKIESREQVDEMEEIVTGFTGNMAPDFTP
jgi:hypothetical protein